MIPSNDRRVPSIKSKSMEGTFQVNGCDIMRLFVFRTSIISINLTIIFRWELLRLFSCLNYNIILITLWELEKELSKAKPTSFCKSPNPTFTLSAADTSPASSRSKTMTSWRSKMKMIRKPLSKSNKTAA